nr:pyrroloquinoline quinone precursor peptide PqqA [Thermocrispum sp.]
MTSATGLPSGRDRLVLRQCGDQAWSTIPAPSSRPGRPRISSPDVVEYDTPMEVTAYVARMDD